MTKLLIEHQLQQFACQIASAVRALLAMVIVAAASGKPAGRQFIDARLLENGRHCKQPRLFESGARRLIELCFDALQGACQLFAALDVIATLPPAEHV